MIIFKSEIKRLVELILIRFTVIICNIAGFFFEEKITIEINELRNENIPFIRAENKSFFLSTLKH